MSKAETPVPDTLRNAVNEAALSYLKDKSAHSDVADELAKAVKGLGDVQTFCPDPSQYRYLAVSTGGVIFGFAYGMSLIAFRLNKTLTETALRTGANDIPELPEWVAFKLFRNDWPEFDLKFWARKAYVFAREAGDSRRMLDEVPAFRQTTKKDPASPDGV